VTNAVVITGQYACAENVETQALGDASFAVGYQSVAAGVSSMAEGGYPGVATGGFAIGPGSHAEGISTVAGGPAGHSEGFGSTAAGFYSHAENLGTAGSGKFDFTITPGGTDLTIAGDVRKWFILGGPIDAVALPTTPALKASQFVTYGVPVFDGVNTTVNIAAPLDLTTTAGIVVPQEYGAGSHAENGGQAVGDFSHAEGNQTITYGTASHAEGLGTIATALYAHAEGSYNIAFGLSSHAEGSYNKVATSAHVEGSNNYASGTNSHAEGSYNKAGYEARPFSCVAGGTALVFTGVDVRAEYPAGATVLVTPQTPFYGETVTKTTVGAPVYAAGNTTVTINSLIDAWTTLGGAVCPDIAGVSAHAEGGRPSIGLAAGNRAIGEGSHAEGAGTLAAGIASHAEGNGTYAGGTGSHAGGFNSGAVGVSSFVQAHNGSIAFGVGASCLGDSTTAVGDGSHAEGITNVAGVGAALFTVAPGGIAVTLSVGFHGGDFTADYANGGTVTIFPGTPSLVAAVTRTVASDPVFAAGVTTFNLSAAIDLYSTGGYIAPTGQILERYPNGISAHVEGASCIACGVASHAEGGYCEAYGPNSTVTGLYCRTGDYPFVFTCVAGGGTLTFAGDVTYRFAINDNIYIIPANGQPAVTRTLITVPIYAAGSTTFDIDAAINGTTVTGRASRESNGNSSKASGESSTTAFRASEAKGYKALGSRDDEMVHGALIATGGAGGPYAPGPGAAQFSRQVRSALLPTVGAGGSLTFLYDLYQSKVYSLQIRTVVTDNAAAAPTVYVMEARDVLVSVDASRVLTIRANQLVLLQDPAVALVTMNVSVAGVGQLGIDLSNPNPAIYRVLCTIESHEISSIDITAT
jgi:hypothetical protein